MQNFTFHNPTRILFGKGRIADISREISAGTRNIDQLMAAARRQERYAG